MRRSGPRHPPAAVRVQEGAIVDGGDGGDFNPERVQPTGRQRDLFPLPVGALRSDVDFKNHCSSNVGRRSTRRALERAHVADLADDMCRTLNEMSLGHSVPRSERERRPTGAQLATYQEFLTAARRFGKPPEDLSGQGAFSELQVAQAYGGDSPTIASLTIDNVDSVSLPVAGFSPAPLENIGDGLGRKLVETMRQLEYPRSEGLARMRERGPKRVYSDPHLRNPQLYVALLRRLEAANLVAYYTSCVSSVGVFFVYKKDGTLRLILDGRQTSELFQPAPKVRLATGGTFAFLEVDDHSPIWVSGVDISNAFYAMGLPDYFRRFFALPAVRADLVGVTVTADGQPVRGSQPIYPCFCAPPMGFSLSLWLCERVSVGLSLTVDGFTPGNMMLDHAPVPVISDHPFVHTEYVDNIITLSTSPDVGAPACTAVRETLVGAGLPCHDVEHSKGGSTLGWEFQETWPCVGLNLRLRWKLWFAFDHLYDRGYGTGDEVIRLVSHFTSRVLIRRELLAALSAVYAFGHSMRGRRVRLWPAVLRELRWCRSLIPLCYRDLGAEWSSRVRMVDASWWGCGIVAHDFPVQTVRALGRQNERWRFKTADAEHSRPRDAVAAALASAGGGEEDVVLARAPRGPEHDGCWPVGPFDEVPEEVWRATDWKRLVSRPWRKQGDAQVTAEGRGMVCTVKNISRTFANRHCRHVIIGDSMAPLLSFIKGRSSRPAQLRHCRQVCSYALACSLYLSWRWVCSECNVADRASRGRAGDYAVGPDLGATSGRGLATGDSDPGIECTVGAADVPSCCRGEGACDDMQATCCTEQPCAAGGAKQDPARPISEGEVWGAPGAAEFDPVVVSGGECGDRADSSRLPPPCCSLRAVGPPLPHEHRHPAGAGPRPIGMVRGTVLRGGRVERGGEALGGHSALPGGLGVDPGELATSVASRQGLAASVTPMVTVAHSLGGGGVDGYADAQPGADRVSLFDGADVRVVPPAVGGVAAHGWIPGRAHQGWAADPPILVHSVAPPGVGHAIQDRRIRRDSGDGQCVLPVPGSDSPGAGSGSLGRPAVGRSDVLRVGGGFCGGGSRLRVGCAGAARAVPVAARRHVLRDDDAGATSTRDKKEGEVAGRCQPPPVRERRPTAAAAAAVGESPFGRSDARLGVRKVSTLQSVRGLSPPPWRPALLELSAFGGHVAEAWEARRDAGPGVWCGGHFHSLDLVTCAARRRVRGLVRARRFRAVMVELPSDTFSVVRNRGGDLPPLRSRGHPLGLSGGTPGERRRVWRQNIMATFFARIALLARQLDIPCIVLGPAHSLVWAVPAAADIWRLAGREWTTLDWCSFGCPCRRRSWAVGFGVDVRSLGRVLCSTRGVCAFSQRPHGVGWTATQSCRMPPALSHGIAQLLRIALRNRFCDSLMNYAAGCQGTVLEVR